MDCHDSPLPDFCIRCSLSSDILPLLYPSKAGSFRLNLLSLRLDSISSVVLVGNLAKRLPAHTRKAGVVI